MADETILPSSVSVAPHIKALDLMVADRANGIDTSVVLMNLIDTCHPNALPYLAEQFNIMRGYKGWRFMNTDSDKRALLKRAIELNKFSGTPYAIEEVLILIGVVGAIEIHERLTMTYDGSWYFDGNIFYGNHWAYFRVILDIANWGNVSVDDIRGVILEYKNVRSRLVDVSFRQSLSDTVQVTDSLNQEYQYKFFERIKTTDTLTLT